MRISTPAVLAALLIFQFVPAYVRPRANYTAPRHLFFVFAAILGMILPATLFRAGFNLISAIPVVMTLTAWTVFVARYGKSAVSRRAARTLLFTLGTVGWLVASCMA